jgi:hypothetical protein
MSKVLTKKPKSKARRSRRPVRPTKANPNGDPRQAAVLLTEGKQPPRIQFVGPLHSCEAFVEEWERDDLGIAATIVLFDADASPPPRKLATMGATPPINDERDQVLAAADEAIKFLNAQINVLSLQFRTPESRYYELRNAWHRKVAGTIDIYDDGSRVTHPAKGGAS